MFSTFRDGFKSENQASFGAPRSNPFPLLSDDTQQNQERDDDMALEDDVNDCVPQKSSFSFVKRPFAFTNKPNAALEQQKQQQKNHNQSYFQFNRGSSENNFATSSQTKGFHNTFDKTLRKEPFGHASGWTKSSSSAQHNGLAQVPLPSSGLFSPKVNQKPVLSKADICDSCNCAIGEAPEPYVIHRFQNTSDDNIVADDQQIFCSMICMARGISEAYNDVYGALDED